MPRMTKVLPLTLQTWPSISTVAMLYRPVPLGDSHARRFITIFK